MTGPTRASAGAHPEPISTARFRPRRLAPTVALALALAACGGGGGGGPAAPGTGVVPPPAPPPPPPPPPAASGKFETSASTSRFLTAATFGPGPDSVAALQGTSASDWIRAEFDRPASPALDAVIRYYDLGNGRARMQLTDAFDARANTLTFWQNAVEGEDQLRQRMIFALSQILVVSDTSGLNGIFPHTVGYYQQILSDHAFGNYRDLLEAVTYSPSMAEYLTYFGNAKADPDTGAVPDENYAREILQLFTVGLVELNPDGTPVLDAGGEPVELYDNDDITGLAKVFTGLFNPDLVYASGADLARGRARITAAVQRPLTMDEGLHSPEAKTFLGTTIPAGTSGDESIRLALDHIMAHPNVGPFVGRQLIQRFTTSNPSPAYVQRVAAAFDAGEFTLPDGSRVGEGRKGDLKATVAAVLFDPDTDTPPEQLDDVFGKVREPVIRLTHFARAFDADLSRPEYVRALFDTASLSSLGQQAYGSPSVFNFYRPGYVAPGTLSGERGLTVPELQIVNASTTPGYINLLSSGAFGQQAEDFTDMRPVFNAYGASFDADVARTMFIPDYADARPLADDSGGLVDYLDDLLLYGSMSDETRRSLVSTLDAFPRSALDDDEGRDTLVGYAVAMVMSSPDYLVQR